MQALFLVRRDRQDGPKCDYWMAVSAGFVQKALTGPMPNAERAQVPASLSLPPDTYHEAPAMTSLHPLSSLRSWTSASRVFITGRFEGQATCPADGATLVRVAGRSGWLVPADTPRGLKPQGVSGAPSYRLSGASRQRRAARPGPRPSGR